MHRIVTWLDRYSDHVQLFVSNHLVLAPLLLLLAEEMGVPILVPGDAILGFVGYQLSVKHTVALWDAFVVAMISVLCGASILFFISKRYGKSALSKLSKFIFLKKSHLDKAEKLFAKYGVWAIIFGRHIPGMRIPVTIFAASSGIRYRVFLFATIISTTFWVLFYLSIGKRYGGDVQQIVHKYAGLSLALLVTLVILIFVLHFVGLYRERRGGHSHTSKSKEQ